MSWIDGIISLYESLFNKYTCNPAECRYDLRAIRNKVDAIHNQIFDNNTLDAVRYPIFERPYSSRLGKNNPNDRNFNIFISAKFNFKTKVWKSHYFQIEEPDWAIYDDLYGYYFPILGQRCQSIT